MAYVAGRSVTILLQQNIAEELRHAQGDGLSSLASTRTDTCRAAMGALTSHKRFGDLRDEIPVEGRTSIVVYLDGLTGELRGTVTPARCSE